MAADSANTLTQVLSVVGETLQLGERVKAFDRATRLLGSVPEFDSMAVVGVINGLEQRFGFEVADDEISADTFESIGTLCDFVDRKRDDM